jgi:predicted transcriptional regulator
MHTPSDSEVIAAVAIAWKLWRPERHKRATAKRDPGATLDEIGRELGITRERVRQIEKAALEKCRAYCLAHGYDLRDLLRRP